MLPRVGVARGRQLPLQLIDVRENALKIFGMFNSPSNRFSFAKFAITAVFVIALTVSPLTLVQAHEHENADANAKGKEKLSAEESKEVTGEVVDMMCYVDHNAVGEKHAKCATTCVKNGGPVGIVSNGKAYLVVGEHKPMNDQLADYCGKTITLKGKLAERGGIAMLENAEIVKK